MLEVRYSTKFHKDYKLIKKRGYKIQKLKDIVDMLRNQVTLPQKFKDHFAFWQLCKF